MIAVSIPAMAESLGESPRGLNLLITTYLLRPCRVSCPVRWLESATATEPAGYSVPQS